MMDIAAISLLAGTVVTAVGPFLVKAAEKGMEEFGKSAMGLLFNKLKNRITGSDAQHKLDALAKSPTQEDDKIVLKVALRDAMKADPSLVMFLEDWVKEAKVHAPAAKQTASIVGANNKIVQVSGSGNTVS
jgi:hypothetical protein